MSKKIFLYVGLPKTGSAFLRQEVFSKLDPSRVCINPEGVSRAFEEMHDTQYSSACKNSVKKMVAESLSTISQDMVLVTAMDLVGAAGDNFKQFDEITCFLAELFPEASIIITLRNQVAWLLSLYKHQTQGLGVSAAKFLNFSDGKFCLKHREDFPNVDALGFDLAEKCDLYVKTFGRENVHILFNEDMVANPENFVCQVGEIFGCDVVGGVNIRTENKGFSTFGIQLTYYKEKLEKPLGLGKSRRKEKKILYRTTSWLSQYDLGKELWRDAISKKGVPYAPAIILRRFLLKLRWEYLIRNGLDRVVYLDWDLMGKKKREILSRHYSRVNEGLRPYFRNRETESHYIATARAES